MTIMHLELAGHGELAAAKFYDGAGTTSEPELVESYNCDPENLFLFPLSING
jgi:hypothetical protein